MSHLHAIFRSLLSIGMPVPELLGHANRVFCQSTLPSNYATLVCGLAMTSGEMEICNAGHCPPIVVRSDGIAEIEATGLPLGLFCDGRYALRKVALNPGDCLILYTDGITEARCRSGDEYGLDRLVTIAAQCQRLPAGRVIESILCDVNGFVSRAAQTDDVTIMALRRLGAS
jgi:sigma-B regulation protein RsbU (phosphoserine phosphatase)